MIFPTVKTTRYMLVTSLALLALGVGASQLMWILGLDGSEAFSYLFEANKGMFIIAASTSALTSTVLRVLEI